MNYLFRAVSDVVSEEMKSVRNLFKNTKLPHMKIAKYTFIIDNPDDLTQYLTQEFGGEYQNSSSDMTVLASEKYYFRNNSTQMNLIVTKSEQEKLHVHVIGGAGGSGLLNINWWSEKGFISRVEKALRRYADAHDIDWK